MDVGIGHPNAVPDTEGRTLVDWARRADQAGFSTLGTIGRLVYANYEELGDIALQIAASAAVSPEVVKGYAAAFAEAGCDELIFVPASSSLEQVGLLAAAVS